MGDLDYSVGLYRSSFASEFSVVVASPRLEALAQASRRKRSVDDEAPLRGSNAGRKGRRHSARLKKGASREQGAFTP